MIPIKHTIDLEGNSPLLLPNKDIAIIGSSGRLRRKPAGPKIDAHEFIVRFNRAPTEGYEDLVGAQTDLRVANNHVFNNNVLDTKEWPGQPPDFIRNLRNAAILYMAPDMDPWLKHKSNTHESCILYKVIYNELELVKKELELNLSAQFSVGVGFVCLCVVSGIRPHLYGFDIEQDSKRDHYWENRPPAGPCHNVSLEKEIFKELQQRNLIEIK